MGSSGGGGGSGKADWPDYMKTVHGGWLADMDILIDAGILANPYTGITTYDPDTDLTAMDTAIAAFDTYIGTFSTGYITAAIGSATVDIMGALAADAIPQFEAGMDGINAVQSTGFVLGEASLYARAATAIAKEAVMLYSQAAISIIDGKKTVAAMAVDAKRVRIVAKGEEEGRQTELDVHETTWPFELYMYGGNLLGSIGGGHSASVAKPPSKAMSALGGAMAGAGTGAVVTGGNPYGIAAGAVIGGVMGYMNAS